MLVALCSVSFVDLGEVCAFSCRNIIVAIPLENLIGNDYPDDANMQTHKYKYGLKHTF